MLSYFKNNKILIFLLLSWVALWASINSYPMPLDISISYLQKINFTKMASFPDGLNILRIYTPLLLINSILFFLLFKYRFEIKFNYFLTLFLFFFIFQLLGLMDSGLNLIDYYHETRSNLTTYTTMYAITERIFLPFLAFNGLLILYFLNSKIDDEQIKIIFYINLFFIILILFIYTPIIWKDFLNTQSDYLYSSQTWSKRFFGHDPVLRVTGLSRLLALAFLIVLIKLNDDLSKKYRIFLIFSLVVICVNVWALQVRLVMVMMIIVMVIYLLLLSNQRLLKNFVTLLFVIFISINFYKVLVEIKKSYWVNVYAYSEGILDYSEEMESPCKQITGITRGVNRVGSIKGSWEEKLLCINFVHFTEKVNLLDYDSSSILHKFAFKFTKKLMQKELELASRLKSTTSKKESRDIARKIARMKVSLSAEKDKVDNRVVSTISQVKELTSGRWKRKHSGSESENVESKNLSSSSESENVESKNLSSSSESENVESKNLSFITSGRSIIWKQIIKDYDYKKIFGYGPQADRFIFLKINKDKKINRYMSNSSNSLFYAFICGGYISLLLMVLINLYVLYLIIIYLKNKVYLRKDNFIINSSFLIILFLGGRSMLENSYAVFSVDFMIFISTVIVFEKTLKSISYKLVK